MEFEEHIRQATCRVDADDGQLGSSFWISDEYLITAAHVVEAVPDDEIKIQTYNNESLKVEVIESDPNTDQVAGTDLAVIKARQTPQNHESLTVHSKLPSIGTDVLWTGYASLFGEAEIDRQRFGWGKVASQPYGEKTQSFFEVDGLFNPSHSGGPVVNEKTGNVVGVVSASAGGFDELESKWAERVNRLTELFNLQQQSGNAHFYSLTYKDPGEAFNGKRVLENLGLDVEMDSSGNDVTLIYSPQEIPMQAGFVQAEISKLLFDTAQNTFQMGVGIASGGEALEKKAAVK
jgi:V8-like Glu-specific endopeptidase